MRLILVPALLASALAAQGTVPPYVVQVTNPHPSLSSPSIPGNAVEQIHLVHLATDPPNVFLCGLTVDGLSAAYGAVGNRDLLTGKYDAQTDTFTPDTNAAALNTANYEFGLTFHHSGLWATFDDYTTAGVSLAKRASVNAPWTFVGRVGGLPAQSYYDPVLADYNGQTMLVHVLGNDIAMTPIDLNNATLMGASTIIVRSTQGGTVNSPTPILDSNGELIGLSHHDLVVSDNDHYLSMDLDPNTPPLLVNDTATWTNNGGVAGGRFIDAEYTPSPYHAISIDALWCTGGRAKIGGSMEVRVHVPPTSSPVIHVSYLLLSTQFANAPLSIPGVQGQLGLGLAGLIGAQLPTHNNANGESLITFNVPNNPALAGKALPCQSITFNTTSGVVAFGNTAALTMQ